MKFLKVITPDNLGKGITFNPQTKKWEVQSGFDCAAISALPSKPWKKGTTLLAKQDGECIQLAALDSIFQEIGVGIAADKTSAFTGETYNVTVTVTNTGESKNELTNLTVQKPLLGNYEIQDVRTSKQGVDEAETLDQLNYNLKGLAKGGTFILRFSVKANDVGTYQFSATVNPNSALDQNAKNNTDTIILKANTKIDTTYVPSVDCPRITATELDSNTELVALTPRKNWMRPEESPPFVLGYKDGINVFGDRANLKGLRIRLDGASTVIVKLADANFANEIISLSNGKVMYSTTMFNVDSAADAQMVSEFNGYSFNGGILEFTKVAYNAVIFCRPAGKNCRWQAFNVRGASETRDIALSATDVVGGRVEIGYRAEKLSNSSELAINLIPSSLTYTAFKNTIQHQGASSTLQGSRRGVLIFRVKSGTAASLNYTTPSEFRRSDMPLTQGKTTITENRVTVAADATSTDSINSPYLQVIIED